MNTEAFFQDPFLSPSNNNNNNNNDENSFLSSFSGLKETEDVFLGWIDHYQLDAKKIDVTSRILFPLSFILFSISYWVYYTSTEDTRHV